MDYKEKHQQFLIRENEIIPNNYSAKTLLVVALIVCCLWWLNEMSLFRVDKTIMRVSSLINLVLAGVIQILGRHRKFYDKPYTKYLIVICVLLIAFCSYTALNFHISLVLLFPLLLAAQYHNRKVSLLALIGSIFSAFAAPVLGNLLHVWDQEYLKVMLEISGITITQTVPSPRPVYDLQYILQVLFYIGLPGASIVTAFSPIMFAVAKTGLDNVNNQVEIMKLSERDQMTNTLNRNCYITNLELYPRLGMSTLACIYFDVNGLHEMNNTYGHDAGDTMLKACARVLKDVFGPDDTYRIGGDEFVCFAIDKDDEELRSRVEKVKSVLSEEGYTISAGIANRHFENNIDELVKSAEKEMYVDKKLFYKGERSMGRGLRASS